MIISESNFQQIHTYLTAGGVSSGSLRAELADHLASLSEEIMRREGVLFPEAFLQARLQVCPEGPYSIQRDLFISSLKPYVQMRKFQFIVGYLASLFILVGYSFKVLHWPTANIQLMTGTALFIFFFIPAYWANRYKIDQLKMQAKQSWYYVLNALLGIVPACGFMLLMLKWPGKNIIFVTGLLILAFYFMPRLFMQMYRNNLTEAKL